MSRLGFIALLSALFVITVSSCKRDELDFDKFSDRIALDGNIALPLIYGELSIEKMLDNNGDSTLVIDGDTVKIVFREDSLFYKSISEVLDLPDQIISKYLISSTSDQALPNFSRVELGGIAKDTIYSLNPGNSVRIDSINLYQSNLLIDVDNNFNESIKIIITSPSIISPTGSTFEDSTDIILPGQSSSKSFNIDNHTIETFHNAENNSAIILKFTPVFINAGGKTITTSEYANISFGFDEIKDFNGIFGFFGYPTQQIDTTLEGFIPDGFNKLTGTLNITNPRINLIYKNTIGLSTDVTVSLDLMYSDKGPINIDLGTNTMEYSDNYNNPIYEGNFLYNKTTTPDIVELVSFPAPDSITSHTGANSNAGADSATTKNWALRNSDLLIGLEMDVPLEFTADLNYLDTIQIREKAPDNNVNYEIEFARLDYNFENYFPFGIGAKLILFDSISNIVLDTIDLNTSGKMLIEPAPVDTEGEVIESSVQKYTGSVLLEPKTAEDLLNIATHIILSIDFITSEYNSVTSVRVGIDNKLNFQMGLEAKGTYFSN